MRWTTFVNHWCDIVRCYITINFSANLLDLYTIGSHKQHYKNGLLLNCKKRKNLSTNTPLFLVYVGCNSYNFIALLLGHIREQKFHCQRPLSTKFPMFTLHISTLSQILNPFIAFHLYLPFKKLSKKPSTKKCPTPFKSAFNLQPESNSCMWYQLLVSWWKTF